MEVIFSAIMGELAGRSVSFLMDRYLNRTAPTGDKRLESLHRLLLRVRVIVEEAEQRRVTGRAMLQLLAVLKEQMYRGCYALDMSRRRGVAYHGQNALQDHREVSHSLAVPGFHPAKRVRLRGGGGGGESRRAVVERVLGSLEAVVADAKEFAVFLTGCPRVVRQPYSMYMFLDNCMFGRQMEMEHVVAFLLQEEGHGCHRRPGVLPIVGSRRVGKTTLVEHMCKDERVRNHFSRIVYVAPSDHEEVDMATLRRSGVIKHRNHAIDEERVLAIVELDGIKNDSEGVEGTVIEGLLGRLHSAFEASIPNCVSKIIVTSRSDKISSIGTVEPLRLQPFTQEAFWYFFKVRAFGSADAAEHPKLVSIAMDMAAEMNGCFGAANIFSGMLRSNLDPNFWSLGHATWREFQSKSLFMYDGCQTGPWDVNNTPNITEHFVFLDELTGIADGRGEVPNISLHDVLVGGARPAGKFNVLAWKSPIPPHYSYVYSCEIQRPQRMVDRKKRFQNIGSRPAADHFVDGHKS
ncbi:hypothetical protein ACP70R_014718 [Stipagrostis hirtigluma subsp. patula]